MALAAAAAGSANALQGGGLVPSPDSLWPRWQARLSLGTGGPLFRADPMNVDNAGLKVSAATLLGDYYFARSLRGVGSGSGFRATSGMLLGTHATSLLSTPPSVGLNGRAFNVEHRSIGGLSVPPAADGADLGAVPYLGLGYTGLAGKGGWGFSADVGLMALSPNSAVKLGRVFNGNQSLDDVLREMRLAPLVQVGVSYSF
jgi:hypothetical protein